MRYLVIILLLSAFWVSAVYAQPGGIADKQVVEISLTKEQFDNLGVLDDILKEKYPQYQGYNGSQYKMRFYGLPESKIRQEMEKIDFVDQEAWKLKRMAEERILNRKIRNTAIRQLLDDGVVLETIKIEED